ncbi:hypothetical protein V2J09_014569 [Rumex salicifolius]
MATAAVIGLSAGKRRELSERFSGTDHQYQPSSTRNVITAKKCSNYTSSFQSNRQIEPIKALKEHTCIDGSILGSSSVAESWMVNQLDYFAEEDTTLEALLLIQKSMFEKQWNLPFDPKDMTVNRENLSVKKISKNITSSGISARSRRMRTRVKVSQKISGVQEGMPRKASSVSPDLLQNRLKGYVRGVMSDQLLSHDEVVELSKKIKTGLMLEDCRSRLKDRLGCEPSDEQLATSLRMSRADLQSKLIESTLARERLSMSNVRLVMSIAQKYDNLGADMADLVQGGLIGLLRGIEKFDSSKGFKISTYVYWWIRQGVSRALAENSRTLRLPNYLHERLSLIRNAKVRLENKGISPTVDNIADCLNLSQKKIKNATEAIRSVFSLDKEAFPSLNGLPGETLHSYVADNRLENQPWHGVDELALKSEVNSLINVTLREREREIIRLYYGLDNECLTWEDISKRIGLSRERVRQVGLVAMEKLKLAARKKRLEAMLVMKS